MIGTSMQPRRPITVRLRELGEEWVLESDAEIATSLEEFDSDDPSENADVWDADGRPARLKVRLLEIIVFELR